MPSQDDRDELLNRAIEFAQQCLTRYDGFIAFAGATGTDGQGHAIAADPRKEPVSDSDEEVEDDTVKDMLLDGLRKGAESGEYRATFLCYDTRVRDEEGTEMNAIAVSLEHRDGKCAMLYLPYQKAKDGDYGYAELIAQPAAPRVFGGAKKGKEKRQAVGLVPTPRKERKHHA